MLRILSFYQRLQYSSVSQTMLEANNAPLKLKGVVGYNGRQNDVLYCHPASTSEEVHTVVYFGGDIQDFHDTMESQLNEKNSKKWNPEIQTNRKCLKWSLDSTANLLHSYFPASHIVVVRPARIEIGTYSCFDNFVPSNNVGVPEHTPTHFALQHLEQLLKNVTERIRSEGVKSGETNGQLEDGEIIGSPDSSKNEFVHWKENVQLDNSQLTLIGFSKGCVVLNQFIYEFHYLKTLTPDDSFLNQFVSRIVEMYWLDGGHGGDKNTWITSRCLLETLARLQVRIHVHVSPYQVRDPLRVWIGAEEKVFCELLTSMDADLEEKLHFDHVRSPTIIHHFEILNLFHS